MKLEELQQLVKDSRTPENLAKATDYIESRKLAMFGEVGYIPFYKAGHLSVGDSLIIPIYSPNDDLILLDTRPIHEGKNAYRKVQVDDSTHIPVYNVLDMADYRLVTEGVINAESFGQNTDLDITACATLTASFNNRVLHYLAASVHKGLIFALDNDSAGVKAAKRVLEFYKDYYPELNIILLDYPYNDLNDFLKKKGSSVFKRHMDNQIKIEL